MAVTVQIRNVPTTMRRRLEARAALAGVSLSDYLPDKIRLIVERPTSDELRKRLAARSPVTLAVSAARAIREEHGI